MLLSRFFLVASFFSVLIVLRTGLFPFVTGKYCFFRACIELSLICITLWWGLKAKRGELTVYLKALVKRPLFIAVCTFVLVFFLASLFANDPSAAFWSTFERGDGAFQMLHYFAFYLLCMVLLRDEKHWSSMLKVAVCVAVLMIFCGIVLATTGSETYNPWVALLSHVSVFNQGNSDDSFVQLFSKQRFQGSFGNPSYVAPYLIFSLLFLWALRALARSSDVTDKIWTALLSFVFLLFFALSDTRGSFFGLAAGMLSAWIYLIIRDPNKTRITLFVLTVVIATSAGIYQAQRKNEAIISSVRGTRWLSSNVRDPAMEARFPIWQSAWKGFLQRPILGWGPENFAAVTDRYRTFEAGSDITETWHDRAHNVILDYLAETGILGAASYLSIFVILARAMLQLMRKRREDVSMARASPFFQAAVVGVLVAYLVQGMVLFDVLPTYICLFLTLAFLTWQLYPPVPISVDKVAEDIDEDNLLASHDDAAHKPAPPATSKNESVNTQSASLSASLRTPISVLLAIGLIGVMWYGSYLPMCKSYAYMSMMKSMRHVDTTKEFEDRVSVPLQMWSPIGQAEVVRTLGSSMVLPIVHESKNNAERISALMVLLNHYELPFVSSDKTVDYCQNLDLLATVNKEAFRSTKDPRYLDAAERCYRLGLAVNSMRPQFVYGLLDIYKLRDDKERQAQQMKVISALWPSKQSN